jgi:flagellar basal-body rod protein FlgG
MMKALNTAATGMLAEQTSVDVTANNLANVNTTGFSRSRAEFQDLMYQTMRAPGGTNSDGSRLPSGLQIGHGVRTVATAQIHVPGSLSQTGNSLDLAIEGSGFFQVQRPGGDIAFTRAGNLKTDAEGRLVTVDGYPIEPSITIPVQATSITVSPDGAVTVTLPNQTASQQVGQLTLAGFANVGGLLQLGRSMFQPTDASGQAVEAQPGQEGLGTIAQGFLEGSNVEVVNEMIDLISSQRAYDINQKVVTAADEMLRRVTER